MIKIINFVLLLFVFSSVYAHSENGWTYISEAAGQTIGYVSCMATGKDGSVWVGSYDCNGVFRYKNNQWLYESEKITGIVFNMKVAPNGDVWFCLYPRLLAKYDGTNYSYFQIEDAIVINDVDVDNNGIVWCATNNGVYKFDGDNWVHYNIEDGLKSRFATWVSLSPAGEPWIRYGDPWATDDNKCFGLSFFNGTKWISFDTTTGLPSDLIDAIEFGPDGYPYISYDQVSVYPHGIMYYNGTEWIQISDKYTGIFVFDTNGTLWSLYDKIVNYSNSIWLDFTNLSYPPNNSFFTNDIIVDNNFNIWLATNNGVSVYSSDTEVKDVDKNNPKEYLCLTNYPNPFNQSTTISYTLQKNSFVKIVIYNTIGQEVMKITDDYQISGVKYHDVNFTNFHSGQYFVSLIVNGDTKKSHKILLLK